MINIWKPNTKNQPERNLYKFFTALLWWVGIQIGLSSNTICLFSEGACFESLLRHWISWLRLLEVFLSLPRKVREHCLKVCHGQIIRQVLQLRRSMNQCFPARFPQNIFRGKAWNREVNKYKIWNTAKNFKIPPSGNAQHLNNLCTLTKLTFVLFGLVSVNSYCNVMFSSIA